MRPVRPGAGAGFTFVEAAVVLAILSILLAVGIPSMSNWMLSRKAAGAASFYKDGFSMARATAVSHNSASRLVLIANANGQLDWRVDVCFPTLSVPCSDTSGAWSSTTAASTEDPSGTGGFRSVQRSAGSLPPSSAMVGSVDPVGADDVYFTPLGWVDSRVPSPIRRISLAPSRARSGAFPSTAVVLTLAGLTSICNTAAAAGSPKGCPP